MDCGTGFINPRPAIEWLSSIYEKSGHGLKEPISYEKVLSNEKEYPNSTVDAKRLVGNTVELLPQNNARKALDIGSGYGFYSAAALQHGFEVTAMNPGKWEPYGHGHTVFRTSVPCEGCLLDVCNEHKMKCILSIKIDKVYQACKKVLLEHIDCEQKKQLDK